VGEDHIILVAVHVTETPHSSAIINFLIPTKISS